MTLKRVFRSLTAGPSPQALSGTKRRGQRKLGTPTTIRRNSAALRPLKRLF